MQQFIFVCLVDTTDVNPKVLQAILSHLFSREPDLIARLVETPASVIEMSKLARLTYS